MRGPNTSSLGPLLPPRGQDPWVRRQACALLVRCEPSEEKRTTNQLESNGSAHLSRVHSEETKKGPTHACDKQETSAEPPGASRTLLLVLLVLLVPTDLGEVAMPHNPGSRHDECTGPFVDSAHSGMNSSVDSILLVLLVILLQPAREPILQAISYSSLPFCFQKAVTVSALTL